MEIVLTHSNCKIMFIRPADFSALQSNEVEYSGISYVPAKDGSVDIVVTSAKPAPLPTYPTMQIDDMLAAGIPLDAVNPHILGNSDMSEVAAAEKILTLVNDNKPVDSSPTNNESVESSPTNNESVEPSPTDTL